MTEICAGCGGRGFVMGSIYDAYGHWRYYEPPQLVCECCGGFGHCEGGTRLLPTAEPLGPGQRFEPPE